MGPIWNENMKMKKEYERPRIAIRGIVLESVIALDSYFPTISGQVEYLDYDEDYIDVQTQSGNIVVF
jgi:hypothetical protein